MYRTQGGMHRTSSASRRGVRGIALWGVRSMMSDAIEKVVGHYAANTFIESMAMNSRNIDAPLISVGDPANACSWEWSSGIDRCFCCIGANNYFNRMIIESPYLPDLSVPQFELQALNESCRDAMDPFQLVEKDVKTLSGGIKDLLGSDHPVLESCAKYFFETDGGKKIRPTMVLAVSYALNAQNRRTDGVRDDLLFASPSQKRLAEITEMIHTASLFHDDVIDKAATRRNVSSVNQVFGNKLAILGGDFLLSRASVSLARLRNLEVVELLSTVIEHLVKGEIMQMKPSTTGKSALDYYLRKNFYKTASLMGHSCLAAAVLGGYSDECKRASYLYGTYVGQAFQLVDDALDFEGSTSTLGKAPLADLKSGLATAPTLFAAEEHPKLLAMINRKFEYPGDVDEALHLVMQSQGLRKCKQLAQVHAEKAIEAISILGPSPARDSLVSLACKVVTRTH